MKLMKAVAAGLVLVFVGCAESDSSDPEPVGRSHEAVVSPADVLGFESTSAWTASQGALAVSSEVSQGQASLSLASNGYAQLSSATIGPLGAVADAVTLDVRPTQVATWGEVRLVVKIPSLGEHWGPGRTVASNAFRWHVPPTQLRPSRRRCDETGEPILRSQLRHYR
jgi:hypothetical protein